jgi:hypothetical protein
MFGDEMLVCQLMRDNATAPQQDSVMERNILLRYPLKIFTQRRDSRGRYVPPRSRWPAVRAMWQDCTTHAGGLMQIRTKLAGRFVAAGAGLLIMMAFCSEGCRERCS